MLIGYPVSSVYLSSHPYAEDAMKAPSPHLTRGLFAERISA